MQTLDFNKRKKIYMKIVLSDAEQTTVNVATPTKGLLTELALIFPTKDNVQDKDAIEDLYDFCARLMSRNKENKPISKALLESCLDFDDLIYFMDAYTDFVNEVTPKN